MPEYDYQCMKCGREFSLDRAMSARNDPALCPRCKVPAERCFAPVSWQWYEVPLERYDNDNDDG